MHAGEDLNKSAALEAASNGVRVILPNDSTKN